MEDQRKQFLVQTPFFGGLDGPSLDRVCELLFERVYTPGAEVFREGEDGRSMYVVREGELMKSQSSNSGRRVKLMRFHPGDFFGETTLIEMQPRQFTVVAETQSYLYELTNSDLYKLYQQDVQAYVMVLQNINRELCRRLRKADDRITEYADQFGQESTQIRVGVGRIRRQPKKEP